MDIVKINALIKEIRKNYHFSSKNASPNNQALGDSLKEIKNGFGDYLQVKLSTTYQNFFPFDEPASLEKYFSIEGALVEKDMFGQPRYGVSIQPNPLRIVLSDRKLKSERIAWELLG